MFKSLVLATTLVVAARAGATTVEQLLLTCGGHYKVLTSEPYFIDNTGTRAPNFAGTHEKIQVLDVRGKDCQKIADHYDVSVTVGQMLDFGVGTAPDLLAAQQAAKARLGQTFPFHARQEFLYAKDGTLPLFPDVHGESVSMLGQDGVADSQALYGTPDLAELSDSQKLKIVDQVGWQMEWGKIYQTISWSDQWLELALSLKPHEPDAQKEHAQQILTFFENASKNGGTFSTASPGVQLGQGLNALLNELGGTKWAAKQTVWKHHPLLFNDQLVSWARFEEGAKKAPLLTPKELEDYLTFAYEQVQALKVVSWVGEAASTMYQFKAAAGSIDTASRPNGWIPPLYVLTPKAQELVIKLLAFE